MTAAQHIEFATTPLKNIKQSLVANGWVLLRSEQYDLEMFSRLMTNLCDHLTYDPARQHVSVEAQKVDAGTVPVGLHIENGNTPMPPDVIAFYSEKSARLGSQTTLCDGAEVFRSLSPELKKALSKKLTVSRYLPEVMWKRYVATALKLDTDAVGKRELNQFIHSLRCQKAEMLDDGGINYHLRFNPIRRDNLLGIPSVANALLGPSYNYEPPVYRFDDGTEFSKDLLGELEALCERYTAEIQWQDGDVVVIDNKRMMHGRREILVPLEERKLYIAMGLGFKPS